MSRRLTRNSQSAAAAAGGGGGPSTPPPPPEKPLSPLGRAFVFYGSYHNDFVNQLIHVTCVPVIFTTALSFLSKLPLPAVASKLVPQAVGRMIGADAARSWALPAAAGYAGYYLSLAPGFLGGSAALLVLGALPASAAALKALSMKTLVGAHVVSWIAQFVGHGAFEGRSPALLDNLFQAIFMAPFFVCACLAGVLTPPPPPSFLTSFQRPVRLPPTTYPSPHPPLPLPPPPPHCRHGDTHVDGPPQGR
jgi:uncharacterized membrane protein YGL010W